MDLLCLEAHELTPVVFAIVILLEHLIMALLDRTIIKNGSYAVFKKKFTIFNKALKYTFSQYFKTTL